MRIVQVCPYDLTRHGGVQRHILDLSEALRGLGHEVLVLAPRVGAGGTGVVGSYKVGVAKLLPFNKTMIEFSYADRAARAEMDAVLDEADVVHLHNMTTPFLSWQIFARSRAARVATFHDFPPETWSGDMQSALSRLVTARLARRLDGMVITSERMRGHVVTQGVPAEAVLPPCTSLAAFRGPVEPAIRFDDDLVNILFLGRLEPRKGAEVLLQAFGRLQRDGVPARLLVVGDGTLRDSLAVTAKTLGLRNVHFAGAAAEGQAPQWYAACDIFCAPSLYGEGFGIVLAEAMASGRPVVAADNAGYRGVLGQSGPQATVPAGDADALADCLAALIANPQLRAELGRENCETSGKFDVAAHVDDFVALYHKAIAAHHAC